MAKSDYDLHRALIAWVTCMQLNLNELSHPITVLQDLTDGVLLYELMTQV